MRHHLDKPALRGVAADDGRPFRATFKQTIARVESKARHLHRRTVAGRAVGAQDFKGALGIALRKQGGRNNSEESEPTHGNDYYR